MSYITSNKRIAYEIDSIPLVDDVEGISYLNHFDYDPISVTYHNNAITVKSGMKLGSGCVYFPDTSSYVDIPNTTSVFSLSPIGSYEFEFFVFYETDNADNRTIFNLMSNLLCLDVTDSNNLLLYSSNWHFSGTSKVAMTNSRWHHILIRITEGHAYVFMDGIEVISKEISGSNVLTPSSVQLGYFIGYIDEFVFRRNAGSGAPIVPRVPYDNVPSVNNNALITRSTWSCRNLPNGLQLSTNGILSGHPTTSGTYNCDVTVSTNWGTDTKTIKIVVK